MAHTTSTAFVVLVVVLSTATINLTSSQFQDENYCLATDDAPYLHFATKTSYKIVKEKKPLTSVPNCKPEAFWALIRHGTRFPGHLSPELTSIRDTILRNHELDHSGELCYEDLDNLKRWTYRFHPDDRDQLTWEGKSDLKLLAGSLKINFPEFFNQTSQDKFKIRFSTQARTRDSAQTFMDGLGVSWPLSDSEIDAQLRPEANCSSWQEHESQPIEEFEKYKAGPEVVAVLKRVSHRLGFKYDLKFDLVNQFYDQCRYDKAIFYDEISPWCAAFTSEDLKIMEYANDLYYYYNSGYGSSLTMKLGCPLVKELMDTFEAISHSNGTADVPTVTLNFGHSLILRSVLVRLGMAKDAEPPRHNNRNANRQWRTSILSPFTGNVYAVLYRCTPNDKFRLMFFVNEHLISYAGCNVGLCDWTFIYDRFAPHVDGKTCNLEFCSQTGASSRLTVQYYLTIMLLSSLALINF